METTLTEEQIKGNEALVDLTAHLDRRHLYLQPTRANDLRVLKNDDGLRLFNALVTKHLAGKPRGIYKARVAALKEMVKEHPEEASKLCECFKGLWPHWMDKECKEILSKLRYCEENIPIKGAMRRLATMGSVRRIKVAGGRRSSSAVPEPERACRYHEGNRAVSSSGLCQTCIGRMRSLKRAGIINHNTSKHVLGKFLAIPIGGKGRGVYLSKVTELRMREGI